MVMFPSSSSSDKESNVLRRPVNCVVTESSTEPTTNTIRQDDDDGEHRGCADSKVWQQFANAITHIFVRENHHRRIRPPQQQSQKQQRKHHQRPLLKGCQSLEEHLERIQNALNAVQDLHGAEGLAQLELAYRWVPCELHDATTQEEDDEQQEQTSCAPKSNNASISLMVPPTHSLAGKPLKDVPPAVAIENSSLRSLDGSEEDEEKSLSSEKQQPNDTVLVIEDNVNGACRHCSQRLFYNETTMITEKNRKDYIAHGKMYEAVCRLAQEYAQDCLAQLGDLEWQDVKTDDTEKHHPPLRILASRSLSTTDDDERPLLVVCTGRGKVRAGIFSRQHLLCTGLEVGTAYHSVQSAVAAGYRLALLDPNVHGEAQGYVTFSHSLDHLVPAQQQQPIDYLLHSASGGHFVRYLMDKKDMIPLRRVAFTDSTHNIQWVQNKKTTTASHHHHAYLASYLQSPAVVYFRSSRPDDAMWHLHAAGQVCTATDTFWRHRFGTISTRWAGTNQHSLTNWSAHEPIWEHFLGSPQQQT